MFNLKKILILSLLTILVLFFVFIFWSKNAYERNKSNENLNGLVDDNKGVIYDPEMSSPLDLERINEDDFVLGERGADIEIIVYEDLSNVFSAHLNNSLNKVREEFSDYVAIAFRPYTNKSFSFSMPMRMFVECAADQVDFFEARDLALRITEDDVFSEDDLLYHGSSLDLDNNLLEKCIKDRHHYDYIERVSREAESFGVYGSPTVFVNNIIVVGARSFDDVVNGEGELLPGLRRIVMEELSRKGINFDSAIYFDNDEDIVFCTEDLFECPDGSYVSRNQDDDCNFFPCSE
jgi:hypothetical protein